LFGYHDAQLYRVGTNHQHLPVNSPRCPFHNQQRDGQMAIKNGGAALNYANVETAGSNPSGFGHGDAGWALNGAAGRYDGRGKEDDFTQAGNLFRILPPGEQQNLFNNLAGPLSLVSEEILQRQLGHFDKADPAYGAGVRAALRARADKA
jgi:catalase